MDIELTLDKTGWPVGPWDLEPDYATWLDEKSGYRCVIKRNPDFGSLNGYVAVDEDSELYNKAYEDIDTVLCHGGLTFSGLLVIRGVEAWCFGFDCAHLKDLKPINYVIPIMGNEIYKDFAYVKDAVQDLARQLKYLE